MAIQAATLASTSTLSDNLAVPGGGAWHTSSGTDVAGVAFLKTVLAYFQTGVLLPFIVTSDLGTITGEKHSVDITSTGVLSSGDSLVGLNIVTTPTGSAGSWVAGIFSAVVEDATKRTSGYMAAGEFEYRTACDTASAAGCLVLQWGNTSANHPANSAYIVLRDWGSKRCRALFEFGSEHTIGSDADTTSLLSANNPTAATHAIRFTCNNVPYWIMAVNLTGLTA